MFQDSCAHGSESVPDSDIGPSSAPNVLTQRAGRFTMRSAHVGVLGGLNAHLHYVLLYNSYLDILVLYFASVWVWQHVFACTRVLVSGISVVASFLVDAVTSLHDNGIAMSEEVCISLHFEKSHDLVLP